MTRETELLDRALAAANLAPGGVVWAAPPEPGTPPPPEGLPGSLEVIRLDEAATEQAEAGWDATRVAADA